jgi:hypothetical protein
MLSEVVRENWLDGRAFGGLGLFYVGEKGDLNG